ncbi:MAG: SRPBCC family protein [Acidobacteria bacterium]|nr:SRPBCC family protein [Acidobacteriota bacterium]
MPVIKAETFILAPVEVCFDLARDVEVHMASTAETGERAVAGVTSGMMELNDEVTWEARHLYVRQRLTSKITAMERPRMFVDEMQRGAFKSLRHLHLFLPEGDGTRMIDELAFTSPLGVLGRIADALLLDNYMRRFLIKHNEYIKRVAEEKVKALKS